MLQTTPRERSRWVRLPRGETQRWSRSRSDICGAAHGARRLNRREVEHLAPHVADNRCVEETLSASFAVIRLMVHDLVRVRYRGKVLARSTGLLALLLSRTLPAGFRCRLGIAVRRRRLGRIARVHAETGPQCHDLDAQLLDRPHLLGHHGPQRGVLLAQILIGRRVSAGGRVVGRNSQRYARRTRRWWTVPSGDLNSYNVWLFSQRPDFSGL